MFKVNNKGGPILGRPILGSGGFPPNPPTRGNYATDVCYCLSLQEDWLDQTEFVLRIILQIDLSYNWKNKYLKMMSFAEVQSSIF